MVFKKYALIPIVFAFALGIFIADLSFITAFLYLALFIFTIIIWIGLFFFKKEFLLWVCFFIIGIVHYGLFTQAQKPTELYNNKFLVQKIITSSVLLEELNTGTKFLMPKYKNVRLKDTIHLQNPIKRPISYTKTPFAFDYEEYLHQQRIDSIIYKPKSDDLKIYSPSYSWINKFRYTLINTLDSSVLLSVAAKQLIGGLVLGEKKWMALDDSLKVSFQQTGLMHILAISGLHIGLVFLIFQSLGSFFCSNGKWKYRISLFSLIPVWVVIIFVGMPISAVRAGLMCGLYAIGGSFNRPQPMYQLLAITAGIILIFDPLQLKDWGFLLSFSAMLGIVIFKNIFVAIFKKWRIPNFISSITSVSLAAQIGVLPFMLFGFHQFPLGFLVANITVLWLIPFLLGLAIISLCSITIGVWDIIPWDFIPKTFSIIIDNGLLPYLNLLANYLPLLKGIYWDNIDLIILLSALFLFGYAVSGIFKNKVFSIFLIFLIILTLKKTWNKYQRLNTKETLYLYENGTVIQIIRRATKAIYISNKADTIIQKRLKKRLKNWLDYYDIKNLNSIQNNSIFLKYKENKDSINIFTVLGVKTFSKKGYKNFIQPL